MPRQRKKRARRAAAHQTTPSSMNDARLAEIVRRVVQVAQPEKIILFGSAARGEMGPHSDVDSLVVKRGEFDASWLTGEIYTHLHGVGQAVDIILVTPEQVEQCRNVHSLIIAPALREGKEIYVPQRYPPEDPREWLNRARSNLLQAK